MDERLLKPVVEGEHLDYSLADLTSWHIGGKAQRYYAPLSINHLQLYLSRLPVQTPLTWLGLGSNILIRDGGVQGAVIATRHLQELKVNDTQTIFAHAGVSCAKVARLACKHNLSKGAFFAGIPGTIGGALRMNAGAFGGETWQYVQRVWVINRKGICDWRDVRDYEISYRSVKGKFAQFEDEAFLGAIFRFPYTPELDGQSLIKELLRKRNLTQPIGTFNCGSVFRNPPNDFAARLIEASGLKGYRINQALISPKHANFIINEGGALAQDVEDLMQVVTEKVQTQFGIVLQPEVKIIGISGQK